jgi:hypothetical protein
MQGGLYRLIHQYQELTPLLTHLLTPLLNETGLPIKVLAALKTIPFMLTLTYFFINRRFLRHTEAVPTAA